MTRKVSRILFAAFVAVFAAGTAALVCAGRRQAAEVTCGGITVHFDDGRSFVSEEEIKGYMDRYYGPYIGQRADSVDLARVEATVGRQSAVEKCEAWMDTDGMLNIGITQRVPVLRIQNGGTGFYVDDSGCIFPLQGNWTARVPVVDGAIPFCLPPDYKGMAPDEKAGEWIEGILSVRRWMAKSKVWADNIVQINVDPSTGLNLIPREGKERFIFGSPDRIGDKFDRIGKYYRFILPSREEPDYRTVDVRFDGQIICRK